VTNSRVTSLLVEEEQKVANNIGSLRRNFLVVVRAERVFVFCFLFLFFCFLFFCFFFR